MAKLNAALRLPGVSLLACVLLLLTGCASPGSAPSTPDAITVQVRDGTLVGNTGQDGSVRVFKGIPYAAPPTRDLRWRPPQPPASWSGVRPARQFAPVCPQVPPAPGSFYQREYLPTPHPASEDCLYLNIWTAAASASDRHPVMVWLYPGGFMWGSGSDVAVDGESLARQGVVLVTLNYRLGALGFLAHPELSAESGRGASGNYGLLDQIAALRWVQDNIEAFGGDAGNVTIFGLSAGAISGHVLTASPLARGLFHRVVAQSGSAFAMRAQVPLAQAQQAGLAYAKALGSPSLQALRSTPLEDLLKIPLRAMPTIDGWLLPAPVQAIFDAGAQTDVPTLVGGTTREGSTMPGGAMTVAQLQQWARQQHGERGEAFLALYPHANDQSAWSAMVDSLSDKVEWAATTWARQQSATGKSPTYLYSFDRAPPGRNSAFYGAYHMADVVYVFDNLSTIDRPWTPLDRQLARTMSAAWVRFARTGDPNGPGLPPWPPYIPGRDAAMVFGEHTGVRTGPRRPEVHRFFDAEIETPPK